MYKLLAGIAAAALTVGLVPTDAQAQQGNGKSNDKQQSGKPGGGPGKPGKQGGGNDKHGGSPDRVAKQGGGQGQDRGPKVGQGNPNRGPDQDNIHSIGGQAKGNGKANGQGKANGPGNAAYKADRGNGQGKQFDKGPDKRRGNDIIDRVERFPYQSSHGLIDGCPPGLAKKNPPCVPPGLAKNSGYGYRSYYRPSFFGLRGIGDGRYYYGDGYLYRIGVNNRIGGFIPLLAGALGIGQPWPSYYRTAPVPTYYQSYYRLSPGGYRYADNVVYRVDPETAAITSIAALLTGDDFRVGQPMPMGYDVYNVPYGYRDRYYDRPDAYYRYSDGYIYQVDPETRLIAAAIELLI